MNKSGFNVIIIFATYKEYAPTLHNILVWDNTQGKNAYIFRDAQMYEAAWKVRDHHHPMSFIISMDSQLH